VFLYDDLTKVARRLGGEDADDEVACPGDAAKNVGLFSRTTSSSSSSPPLPAPLPDIVPFSPPRVNTVKKSLSEEKRCPSQHVINEISLSLSLLLPFAPRKSAVDQRKQRAKRTASAACCLFCRSFELLQNTPPRSRKGKKSLSLCLFSFAFRVCDA